MHTREGTGNHPWMSFFKEHFRLVVSAVSMPASCPVLALTQLSRHALEALRAYVPDPHPTLHLVGL